MLRCRLRQPLSYNYIVVKIDDLMGLIDRLEQHFVIKGKYQRNDDCERNHMKN